MLIQAPSKRIGTGYFLPGAEIATDMAQVKGICPPFTYFIIMQRLTRHVSVIRMTNRRRTELSKRYEENFFYLSKSIKGMS